MWRKLLAALVPFSSLSLPSCRVWVRYKVWILPFAESGLLPYQCPKVHDDYSSVSNYLLIKLTCLELINAVGFGEICLSSQQALMGEGLLKMASSLLMAKQKKSEAFHSASV